MHALFSFTEYHFIHERYETNALNSGVFLGCFVQTVFLFCEWQNRPKSVIFTINHTGRVRSMIKPAMLFGNHMVLQRNKPIKIWGECSGETIIKARLAGQEALAVIEGNHWHITFPPMEACESTALEIWSDREHNTYENVAIGEVWVAGGQSNMQFYLRYDENRKEAAENPRIRMFDQPRVSYQGQLETFDYSEFGCWRLCREADLDYFSAAAYYFAVHLEYACQVPIGIVGCSWGATPACAWMDPKYLEDNEGRVWLDDYRKTVGGLDLAAYEKQFAAAPNYQGRPFEDAMMEKMMYGMSEEEWNAFMQEMIANAGNSEPMPLGPKSEQRPGGLYEHMVKKIAPFSVRGVIWYQGENDEGKPQIYHTVFANLIRCWRDLWEEELPFLFVQLAPFGYWGSPDVYPRLRHEQEWVSRNVPDTWMASIMDAGDPRDIHPKRKQPVGERLALLARGHVYGETICCDPPEYESIVCTEGRVALAFRNADTGLVKRGDRIQALAVMCDGTALEYYEETLEGNRLLLVSPKFHGKSHIKVEFAESAYCQVNLYSREGLPVKPFTAECNMGGAK